MTCWNRFSLSFFKNKLLLQYFSSQNRILIYYKSYICWSYCILPHNFFTNIATVINAVRIHFDPINTNTICPISVKIQKTMHFIRIYSLNWCNEVQIQILDQCILVYQPHKLKTWIKKTLVTLYKTEWQVLAICWMKIIQL